MKRVSWHQILPEYRLVEGIPECPCMMRQAVRLYLDGRGRVREVVH